MELPATSPPFDDVRRIVVLRGGGLGDFVLVEPALRALASAYPEAELTLLGGPLAVRLLAGRPGPVRRVEELPVVPGVRDGAGEDRRKTADFLERMTSQRFDLAVQLHGGGRNSNPFLLRLGARHTVGTATPDAAPLERNLPYLYYQHAIVRALEVVALAGAVPVTLEPRVEVTAEEFRRGALVAAGGDAPLLVLHPGATDPRRRWPTDRFAAVVCRAVDQGARVLIVGDDSDVGTARAITVEARSGLAPGRADRVTDLSGQLGLEDLVGLFAHTDVMIGNDSGPRHLAQAVGAPTVGIYWIGNLINAGPLTRSTHRVQLSWTTRCPVCGRDATQPSVPRCEHDVSFVADVATDAVMADVDDLMARIPPARG